MLGDILSEREQAIIQLKRDNPKISSRAAARIVNNKYAKGNKKAEISHKTILQIWKDNGLA